MSPLIRTIGRALRNGWDLVTSPHPRSRLDGMHQRGSAGRDIGRCCLGAAVFLTSFQLTGEGPVSLPSPSASLYNPARIVAPPSGFVPTVPKGFRVSVFASGFEEPRWLAVAPNGDVFVSDSAAGRIVVLPDPSRQTPAKTRDVFAEHLSLPFGIAFRGDFIYVAEQNAVDRFRFDRRTSRRLGEKEQLFALPEAMISNAPRIYPHWTRSLAFSQDGKLLFVSVGTKSNVSLEHDPARAVVLVCDPDARSCRVYARGLRNAVGIAVDPATGHLWADVNERGDLGDDLPPDYFTHVREGGFYGFPFSYIGGHVDLRVKPQRPDLVAKSIVPDVLLPAHSSPLQCVFYEGRQFPRTYWHGAFIAEHGSTNRSRKIGYAVVFVPFRGGKPTAGAELFASGWVPDPAQAEAYGRPVGVAVAKDGSLLVSDDGAKVIWRVFYQP